MPLPGGFTVGRGLTVYGAFSAASREATAYLDYEKRERDAQGSNAGLAAADIAYRQRAATSIPVAGELGLAWRDWRNAQKGEPTAEDVQNILRDSQQAAEKAALMKRSVDFRRSLTNATYLTQDVNDQEQSRREREVAREEQRHRIRDNQTAQVGQLAIERDRKLAGAADEARRLAGGKPGDAIRQDLVDRVEDSIRKDYESSTRKLSAQTQSELGINDQRFAGEAAREARERGQRVRDVTLQAAGLGNRLRGDTDAARRVELERDIEGEQNAANQRSPLEGAQYAKEIAPRKRLELEQEINRQRVFEARQSQDRITDATGEGEEAMLNATRHHYEAAAATLKRSIDDQVKSLHERADAEQDITRKTQLNAEADATARAGAEKVKALSIQQTTEMEIRAASINAQSDVTELRTQHRALDAARRAVNSRIDGALAHLDAGDTRGRAALERQRGVDLGEIEENRRRQNEDLRNRNQHLALENAHRPYSAQYQDIEQRYKRGMEDAGDDPVRQGLLGRQRQEELSALHEQLKKRTSFKSTLTDIYFGLQGNVLSDTGDFSKRMRDRDEIFRRTDPRFNNAGAAALRRATDPGGAARTDAKFEKATDKFDQAAQKILDSKPMTVVR